MHVLTFSPQARSHLTGQIARSKRTGAGFTCAYPLMNTVTKKTVDIACLNFILHGADIVVSTHAFGRNTCITLPFNQVIVERVIQVLSEHANSPDITDSAQSAQGMVLLARSSLLYTLRIALSLKRGEFLLPLIEDLAELYLILDSHPFFHDRLQCRFELKGVWLAPPETLPTQDEDAELRLLELTRHHVANFRSC